MGEADFNQFMGLRNQLDIGTENFGREENVSPVLIPTKIRDTVEQLKLANEKFGVVDRGNRKTCVTLLQHNMEKPENSNAQVQLLARKKGDEKFQQVVYVI